LQQWFENFRNLADLEAQITSAYWTRVAAVAGIASIFVSLGALLGLLRSLRQTTVALNEARIGREDARVANEAALAHAAEANRLARLERRPWLSVKLQHAGEDLEYRPRPEEHYAVTPITVEVTNHGGQPAIFTDANKPVKGIECFDQEQCYIWKNFEETPLKEVIFPGQTIRKTILFQTPLDLVEGAHISEMPMVPDQFILSGGLHIGVVYMDADRHGMKARTMMLIRWQALVPTTIFRENERWQYKFSFSSVSNSAI
jgi:hypothetical protein